jgi:hypothetical protein
MGSINCDAGQWNGCHTYPASGVVSFSKEEMERFRGNLPCSAAQRRLIDDGTRYVFQFGLEDGRKLNRILRHIEGRRDGYLPLELRLYEQLC